MRRVEKVIFRIIDANLNRSREGLRVCEEVSRFILNSDTLTKELKRARHAISAIIARLPPASRRLFDHRDAEGDVGRASKTRDEMRRAGYRDIFEANMERVKESLRVLEEFFKLVDVKRSAAFKNLRFKIYDIEKRALKRIASLRDTG